jgi:hypothetical protein
VLRESGQQELAESFSLQGAGAEGAEPNARPSGTPYSQPGPDAQLLAKIAAATAEQEELLGNNEKLQRHIRSVLDLRRKGNQEEENMLGTAEARYASLCASLDEQKTHLANIASKYDRTVEELRQELQDRLTKATQVQNVSFHLHARIHLPSLTGIATWASHAALICASRGRVNHRATATQTLTHAHNWTFPLLRRPLALPTCSLQPLRQPCPLGGVALDTATERMHAMRDHLGESWEDETSATGAAGAAVFHGGGGQGL